MRFSQFWLRSKGQKTELNPTQFGAQTNLGLPGKLPSQSISSQGFGLNFKDLNIAAKIGWGYALAIGFAVFGTTIGLHIGNYYQIQAQRRLAQANQQQYLLAALDNSTSDMQSHPQNLFVVIDSSLLLEYEKANFRQHTLQVRDALVKLEEFLALDSSALQEIVPQESITDLPEFLATYGQKVDTYEQQILRLWQTIQPKNLNIVEEIAIAEQQIVRIIRSASTKNLKKDFERLSEQLHRFQQQAEKQKQQARQELDQANVLRLWIIISSMVISTTIAVILATVTNRTIAQPIQTLTQVAQQAVQEENFDLEADVSSQDETGRLAQSFNQLIRSVKQLLEQQREAQLRLESYNQTLEEKVAERTQELNEKNNNLQQLLEELHRTQSQMIQSEKMSSIGQLVAGVAHEINNPINFVHGNLNHAEDYANDLLKLIESYQSHYPSPPVTLQQELEATELDFLQQDMVNLFRSMKVGTKRIREIVLSLRNFSRLDEADFKSVDIHEGIDNTLLILKHRLKATNNRPAIQVVKDYSNLPPAECYPGQLNQVFMNLLANAIDALEESNKGRTLHDIRAEPNKIRIETRLEDNHQICIKVADNGPGIPDGIQSQLFDPFFTTKPVGEGTGLGLSISYQIVVEKHKGKIHYESSPGEGTAFIIQIPLHQKLQAA
jgi:signal transduction histidine kinase